MSYIPHIIFAVLAVTVIIVMAVLLKKWENNADTADILRLDEKIIDPQALVESEDYFTYMDAGLLEQAFTDEKLNILILGDEAVSVMEEGTAVGEYLTAELLKAGIAAQIDSFGFPGIHYSPYFSQLYPELPENFITLYEIIKSLCAADFAKQIDVLGNAGLSGFNDEKKDIYETLIVKLSEINMDDIDAIVISTGIWDYQAGVAIADLTDLTAVYTHAGAVNASARLIMESRPRIRLIVMSPTYFRTEINGTDEGADTASNGKGRLGDYMTADKYVAVDSNFSYLDNLFGSGINEQNYREYLEKNLLFPNDKGRKIIAERISGIFMKDFKSS